MSSGRTICHSPVVLEVLWVVWTRSSLGFGSYPPSLAYSPLLFPHCLDSYYKELPIASKPGALFLPTFPRAMPAKNAHPCAFPLAVSGSLSLNLFYNFNGLYSINEDTQWTHLFCRSAVLSQVPEHVLWWGSDLGRNLSRNGVGMVGS